MAATVGDFLLQRLSEWGVRRIYGYPGDGINGLITIAKVWREWRDPRLTVRVLNNGDLNQVTWEQRVMQGDPKFEASQNVRTSGRHRQRMGPGAGVACAAVAATYHRQAGESVLFRAAAS